MAERAQVTSVEAVESFRADLIVFLSRARAVLEEASDDVLRTRLWVQNDQRRLWEGETRVRYRKLEEARAELFNAFNHANLNNPDSGISDGNAGKITSATAGRIAQFGLKYSF